MDLVKYIVLFIQASSNDQNIKSKCKRRATAAIDFGTSYSVYAFSWKSNWRQIQSKDWNSEYFYSSKSSHSLILNPDQTFLAFGYGAGLEYFKSDDNEDDEEVKPRKNINDFYFFPGFKDLLYNNQVSVVLNQILGHRLTHYIGST